ncbi:MAG: thioesterase family protein [Pseudomonadales bacterium]|jgi:acyl-CoA thioester hydrolase|nr:thioesterase family protein [Pseudomonadales bacterium]MDP6472332.1 thioesterase family protein [Pseudomonadales bacterium]MDP6828128.1 thioesterase family protein [Pseudomonadales bacterium]MDP6971826.1 thioesterase family protein [Pseudomonadales bacterium]|tara:strand:+ start:1799 stop:2245 length:447 start_codon:yes stop_codon:yes gene_type:complete
MRADVWDLPDPFCIELTVTAEHIDGFGHVSNVHYIQWLTNCAWAHSAAVDLPESVCVEMQRGMAVRGMRVQMLASAYEGDHLLVANWLVDADARLRATRQFQIVNAANGVTLIRAHIDYVCVNLASGRPARMPAEFAKRYAAGYRHRV